MRRFLLLVCALLKLNFSLQAATFNGDSKAVVAGCVDAISGEFRDSEIDLEIAAPEPLALSRIYADGKWLFVPQAALFETIDTEATTVYAFEPNGLALLQGCNRFLIR